LRGAEGGDALAKDADHGEVQVVKLDRLPDRVLLGIKRVGQVLGEESDLAAGAHVFCVEEAPAEDLKVADLLKALGHSDHAHRPFVTFHHNGNGQVACAGDLDHLRDLLVYRLDIGKRDLVGE